MSEEVTRLRKAAVERALQGAGKARGDQRRAAYDNRELTGPVRELIEKVAQHAWKITDEDVVAAKRAGLSEDAIFELVVCAAYGQATRQLEGALAAVDQACAALPGTATKESP